MDMILRKRLTSSSEDSYLRASFEMYIYVLSENPIINEEHWN